MLEFKCKLCNGNLKIGEDYLSATCQYCGRQFVLTGEMLAYATKLKMEDEKKEQQRKRERTVEAERRASVEQNIKDKRRAFCKSSWSKALFFLCILALIGCIILVSSHEYLLGLVSATGALLFLIICLRGLQIIRQIKPVVIIALVFVLCCTIALPLRINGNATDWPRQGLATNLPAPKGWKTTIVENTDASLIVEVKGVSSERYDAYVNACKELGYTIIPQTDYISHYPNSHWVDYSAYNADGFFLMLNDSMEITLIAPNPVEEIQWSQLFLSNKVVRPTASMGYVVLNEKESLTVEIVDISAQQYSSYIDACISYGYELDIVHTESTFVGYSTDGYKMSLTYIRELDKLTINVDAPYEMAEITWPKTGVAKQLPKPSSLYGYICTETDNHFYVYIGNMTMEDYKAYVSECMEAGFNIDYDKSDTSYYAHNRKGYTIELSYEGGNIVYFEIDAPRKD